jgi:predicted MPP superfamily phosphohydrolase
VRQYLSLAVPAILLTASAVWQPSAPSVAAGASPATSASSPATQFLTALPRPESLKFAVVGDAGDGDRPQYEVGGQMAAARAAFPFEFVIALGDNMYGRQDPQDFVTKFQKPYQQLLEGGVRFYGALGNHDKQDNRFYPGFNMGGERFYTFARQNVRFVVLDTNVLDPKQLAWAEETLRSSQEAWKIAYFHHPLYSSGGRHGSDVELRIVLEPLLVRYGVSVVFTSHDHIYERTKPQKGITYFVEGSSGRFRKGDLEPSPMTAAGFDEDRTFMLVEIAGEHLSFRTMSRTGVTVDSGVITRRSTT